MWIHEYKNWTNFYWDVEIVSSKLTEVRYKQGLLLGKMSVLGFELKQEASLSILTSDVVKTSSIEGENLDTQEVRSSIARKLGIDIAGLIPSSRDVDGIVDILLDATQKYEEPLTKDRLFAWHSSLFPTGRSGMHKIIVADWRDDKKGVMQVISGVIGKETVHFQAPDASRLDYEMTKFINWYESNNNIDPIIKAGIAHLWFITIHPFDDGNGRIARAITDMVLARTEKISNRFYSLSSQIELNKKDYYKYLENQQRSDQNITNWLLWFIECLNASILNSDKILSDILLKTRIWDVINADPVNERQKLIINRMLDSNFEGFMNTSKYAKMAKCSNDTALRDIQILKKRNIFVQNESGGRSTSYRINENL
ncbi:Fic family protein [Francisella sp. SYW-2]|uniref:Fic family protein n=1 Tax=Francisella sp. SYW-2 TaxID=2610886 RepID=UPI00123E0BAC|nr:Fic family protein [Francisella sp. SYW-2]